MLKQTVIFAVALSCLVLANRPVAAAEPQTRYYRQLVYNHVSPYVPIRGIYEISPETAQTAPHYVFRRDEQGRLREIINHNMENEPWRNHPLTQLQVYRTLLTYTDNQEIRTFFDAEGHPIVNIRGAYREVYSYDAGGFKYALEFFDINDQPAVSNWGISRYTWAKVKDWVVEKRLGLAGELMPVSPYFPFFITGLQFTANGFPLAHYNLNEDLNVTDNKDGVAVYRDQYDAGGNHLEFAYYNAKGEAVLTASKFAKCRKVYDEFGNVVRLEYYNLAGQKIFEQRFTYDAGGKLITVGK